MGDTVALIVATSTVAGRAMALVPWGSRLVLEHVVLAVREAGIESIVVVIGPSAEDIVAAADLGDAVIVIDPEWHEGTAASLRCGLDELMRNDRLEVAVLLTAEQPQVAAPVIADVVAARAENETPAAMPKYRYATGLPVAVHRDLWPRLMGLEGDASAEALFKAHPEWVHEVWVDQIPPTTVSTADQLDAIAPRP